MTNTKIVVPDLSLRLQDPKTLKRVKISESLFRDFLIGINQIDHEESENLDPENQGFVIRELNTSLIKSKFQR